MSTSNFLDKDFYILLGIIAAPTVTMLAGSVAAYLSQPSDQLRSIVSALAGGLLLGSVAFELGPLLVRPAEHDKNWNFGILAGCFISFCTIMILDWIGSVLDPDQESSPADDAGEFAPHSLEEHGSMSSLSDGSMSQRQPLNPPSHWQGERPSVLPRYHPNPSHRRIMNTHRIQHHSDSSLIMHTDAVRTRARAFRLGRRRISKLPRGLRRGTLDSIKNVDVFQPSTPAKVIKTPRGPGELQPLLEASGSHLDSTVASSRGQQLDTSHHSQAPSAPYPIGPVVLVFIDGISDGLTMGITETLGVTQGIILGISLAVEMAFTGAALAAILSDRGTRRTTSLITLTVVPFSMLIGGILGRFLMMEVDEASPVFAGFMSFVVGQLFYLATVELIGEGHAIVNDLGKAAFSRWFDVALLFGFMGELMVEIFLD